MKNSSSKQFIPLVRKSSVEGAAKKKQKTTKDAVTSAVVDLLPTIAECEMNSGSNAAAIVEDNLVVTSEVIQPNLSLTKPDAAGEGKLIESAKVDGDDNDDDDDAEEEEMTAEVYVSADPDGDSVDDLQLFADAIKRGGGDKLNKPVCDMIYLLLKICAVDAVYATDKTKNFNFFVKIAEEMERTVQNMHVGTQRYYFEKFIGRLPNREIPEDVVKEHNNLRAPTLTIANLNKLSKAERNTRKPEECVAAVYGKFIWDAASKAKNKISSKMANKWRTLNSGETYFGLFYAIRKSLYEEDKKAKLEKSVANSLDYNQRKLGRELDASETQTVTEKATQKFRPNDFKEWYPLVN